VKGDMPKKGDDGWKPLGPNTVLEIQLIIRGALNDVKRRGIVTRNVAAIARAPKLRAIPKVVSQAWTAQTKPTREETLENVGIPRVLFGAGAGFDTATFGLRATGSKTPSPLPGGNT